MAEALTVNKALTSLEYAAPCAVYCHHPLTACLSLAHSLLRNDIGEEGAKAILDATEGKPQLTTLCGIKPEETKCNLFSNQDLKAADAMLLAFDLRKNSSLVELK